jgi:hypothetical protein
MIKLPSSLGLKLLIYGFACSLDGTLALLFSDAILAHLSCIFFLLS